MTALQVFKATPVSDDKFFNSRNSPVGCEWCQAVQPVGVRFKVCSACKVAQYCSKEHQKLHWKKHKETCARLSASHEQVARLDKAESLGDGMPTRQALLALLEDWIEVHFYSITSAMANAIRFAGTSFNFRTHFACIRVSYNVDSEGNPGTAFLLNDLTFQRDLIPTMSSMRQEVEATDLSLRAQNWGGGGYLGYLMCFYIIEGTAGTLTFLTANGIVKEQDTWMGRVTSDTWLSTAQRNIRQGKVWRAVRRRFPVIGAQYVNIPGKMERKGNKWVWKKT
ncbi:hypothetical protein B0H10DRAFT_2021262 [Mycena sp. CBHHK59/15]|nr:hypothetical protein B0H10DRAFT_2021262 [Mycena sp. CBHHK59/15]